MMDLHSPKASTLLLIAVFFVAPLFCAGQAVPAGSRPPSPSDVDIYVGYGYFHPVDSDIYGRQYQTIPGGLVASVTGYFSSALGFQAEYAKFPDDPDYCFSTIQAGPVLRHQLGRLVPFAHVLGGAAQVGPPYVHNGTGSCTWGWAVTGGVGLDYILPAFNNHLAIRPIEADFNFSDVNFGSQVPPGSITGGVGQIYAYRLGAGLVYRLGEAAQELPAAYGCEVQPVSVYPGDPITVSGRVINLEEKKKLLAVYTWSTTGGRIAPTTATPNATIATSGLAAGDYTVTGHVSEGGQANQHADCTASFRVVAYQPPTIACSANPTSIAPGGFSTITSVATSPQNRPLNYSFGTTAGQITATGATATLATADVAPGAINVTCNAVDDVGNSSSATTTVTVVAPPAPPPAPSPTARSLCSISFERDRARPVRVDNEAKGCLDDIALELNREPDAVLVVVGKHDPQERPEAAAERTLNVKQYLTDEKGIDPNRIEVRTGETTGRTVDNVLVPPGATWDTGGTTSFDPNRVPRHGEPYAPSPPR
jgi:hypothetical protein